MLIRLFSFFILISSFGALAQELTYLISEDIDLRRVDEYQGLLHHDTSGYTIYLYERDGKGLLGEPGINLIIEKYGNDLTQEFSYEYGYDDNSKNTLGVISNGRVFLWSTIEKRNRYSYAYMVTPILLQGMEGDPIMIFENKVDRAADIPSVRMMASADSTHMGMISFQDSERKKETFGVQACVFDFNGELTWNRFQKFKSTERQFEILDQIVTHSGDILILAKQYLNPKGKERMKDKRGKEIVGYELVLYQLTEQGNLNEIEIDLDGQYLHDARIIQDRHDYLICGGFTSAKSNGPLNGLFFLRYDSDLLLMQEDQKEFSFDKLIDMDRADVNVSARADDKGGLDRNYNMKDIIVAADGQIHLRAEEYDLVTNFSYNAGSFRNANSQEHHIISNDIVTVTITTDGRISDEIQVVSKKQRTYVGRTNGLGNHWDYFNQIAEKEPYLSHTYMDHEGSLYYLFNDNESNIKVKQGKKPRRANDLRRMRPFIVDSRDAIRSKEFPFGEIEKPFLLSPNFSMQISNNQLFFSLLKPSTNGTRQLRIGVMDF